MRLTLCYCKSKPWIVAISGVKNSGKTTLITRLIPVVKELGYCVATIKHDGHEFEGDVEGTDTYKHTKAGAYGTAIFSNGQFVIKKQQSITERELILMFPEADLILLEGFKYSSYPKVEVIRKGNSEESVCNREGLFAIVTDTSVSVPGVERIPMQDTRKIADCILEYFKEEEKKNGQSISRM